VRPRVLSQPTSLIKCSDGLRSIVPLGAVPLVLVTPMRILVCLNRDLASNVALNLLLPALAGHEVKVGLTERVGTSVVVDEPPGRAELRIAEQTLPNEVLFPLVERAAFLDDGRRYLTFGEIERHRGIPVQTLLNPNAPPGLELVEAFAPDLIVTIRYGAILKAPVIRAPRLGVLNLHSGALPEYRGVLATFRALMHGDSEIACTLHYISDGTIDTGDIIGIERVAVNPSQSLLAHILALYPPGIALMTQTINALMRGEPIPHAQQPSSGGAYYTYPTANEWAEFTRKGWRVASPNDLLSVYRLYFQQSSTTDRKSNPTSAG
jgi:methionyl-tRNA formyltransferase